MLSMRHSLRRSQNLVVLNVILKALTNAFIFSADAAACIPRQILPIIEEAQASVFEYVEAAASKGEKMPFEVFDKKVAPSTTKPFVTVQKRGLLSINRVAAEMLGTPEAVELMYDREEQIIGLRAADPDAPRSFPLRRQRESVNTTYLVAGQAFTNYYSIPTEVARRYKPEMQGDILAVDLKQEAAIATGPRIKEAQGV